MKLTEKKLSIKSILLITVILPVIVILASSVAIYITAKSVQPQDTFDMSLLSDTEKAVEAVPSTAKGAAELFETLITDAVNSGVLKYSGSTPVTIDSIECDNKAVQDVLMFASSSFSSEFSEMYEARDIKYGEDASLLLSLLPGSTPSSFEAEISEDGRFSLSLNYTNVFSNMYFIGDDTAAVNTFITENTGVFSAINQRFIPEKCVYTLTCDSVTGEISSLDIGRTYDFSANIAFQNTLSAIGSTPLEMKLTFTDCFSLSYAGIKIAEDIMTLDKNGYNTLTVTPFTEENLAEDEFSLEFISSDPSVATVDENGQVEAVKESEAPVEISVKLTYLGKTFSDTCKVYVVTEVERVNISETELTLNKGDTHSLSAEIKPDDATIKTVIFVSSDENVVTVDENGLVTATGEGTAEITAVSSQGALAATCKVTVTK